MHHFAQVEVFANVAFVNAIFCRMNVNAIMANIVNAIIILVQERMAKFVEVMELVVAINNVNATKVGRDEIAVVRLVK
jgi:hypothetical protein